MVICVTWPNGQAINSHRKKYFKKNRKSPLVFSQKPYIINALCSALFEVSYKSLYRIQG